VVTSLKEFPIDWTDGGWLGSPLRQRMR